MSSLSHPEQQTFDANTFAAHALSSPQNLAAVRRLLPSLVQLRTQVALLSGGEPLLNPEWPVIATALREAGLKAWLLTSGLSLAKHARRATALFEAITVSMDGADASTYRAIRGLDAWDTVAEFASRIVANVETVTTPRADVDAIVTEWGIAELRGCDLAERARRMIAIAAPEHRDVLSEQLSGAAR